MEISKVMDTSIGTAIDSWSECERERLRKGVDIEQQCGDNTVTEVGSWKPVRNINE